MDDPALEPDMHRRALQGLERIHRLSGSVRTIWSALRPLAQTAAPGRLRVLDLACGGGDVTIGIARRARQSGLRVQVDGCDISPLAIQFARERLRAESLKGMHFFTLDVLRDPLPEGYDVVMASLFLHHLDNEQAVEMLRRMAEAARRMALVHDLRRTSAGYVLAWVGCRIAARCRVNHLDGPLSVRASFREAEIERLAADAGWHGAQFVRCWPQRFLLSWQKGE